MSDPARKPSDGFHFLGLAESLVALAELLVRLLERGQSARALPHQPGARRHRGQEEDVFEGDPAGVLEPAPAARVRDSVNRFRPEQASQQVIRRNDQAADEDRLGVAVEGKERQGPEDVEMGLDPPARQVDEENRREHLAYGDTLAGHERPRLSKNEDDGENGNQAAQNDGGPDVRMKARGKALPAPRRRPYRERHAEQPLRRHEHEKEPVGLLVAPAALMLQDRRRPNLEGVILFRRAIHRPLHPERASSRKRRRSCLRRFRSQRPGSSPSRRCPLRGLERG